jgi:outer membrane protein assembly factor BamB
MDRRLCLVAAMWFLTCPAGRAAAVEPSVESTADTVTVAATDWPWWRGPNRNGIAAADQRPPLKWDDSQNVRWAVPVAGRGHGSPTVVGSQIFLATADKESGMQSVVCYDRQTGRELWNTVIHRGGLSKKGNGKASQASSTVACDGRRVFINFVNDGAVFTTALSRAGKQLWQTRISDYVIHQGYGSSPAVYGSLLIVTADNKGGGAVAALKRATGKIVWKSARPKTPNYSSPIVLRVGGRDQLLLTGCDLVSAFDPSNGKKLWEIEGATTECVTSTVTDGNLIITSGGYPRNHMSAILADGSGEVVWQNKVRVYVPSVLISDGYLYAVSDAGVAMCFKADDGREVWKHRLGGGFTASPVLVGKTMFATNEGGKTFIFKAQSSEFELVGENQLGDEVFATPTICGSRVYMRIAKRQDDKRQEMLYCLEKQP